MQMDTFLISGRGFMNKSVEKIIDGQLTRCLLIRFNETNEPC